MSSVAVDHLVVAAPTLDAGVAWCEATLGVTPGPGGRHVFMGTHNRLLSLASEAHPQAYLEIIAIDPDAGPLERPRWFGLDAFDGSAGPRLLHWVARTTVLGMHRQGLLHIGLAPGEPVQASRDTPTGRLSWQILLREDGQLLAGGALPTLIQWQGPHPCDRMAPSGVELRGLSLCGLPPRARELLRPRGVGSVDQGPALSATLHTPVGERVLHSL